MLPFVFNPTTGVDDYVEYALDVPMYFIMRGGDYIDLTGLTFAASSKRHAGQRRPSRIGRFT